MELKRRRRLTVLGLIAIAATWVGCAHADVLLDEAHTVTAGAPVDEQSFLASQAGAVEIDVTDLAFPAALTSIRAAVTQGAAIVGTPLTASGKITFNATAGTTYVVRIIGRPDPASYAGSVAVNVVRTADGASLKQYVANLQLPGTPPGLSVVTEDITIPEAGTYTFALADHGFPVAFPSGSLYAAVTYGSQPLGQVFPGQPLVLSNLAASVSGAPAQYAVTIVAQADATAGRGLYGLRVTGGPSENVVFDRSLAVGPIDAPENIINPAAGNLTLQVTDFAFPAPLTQVTAILTAGGADIGAPQAGTGTSTISAPAGSLQLWRIAQASASGGSYLIAVNAPSGANLYTDARGVSAAVAGGITAYTFPFTLASAGSYTAQVTDFQFPSSLQSLQFAVAQNGTLLQSVSAAGQVSFSGAAGSAAILVIAQPPTGGSGLFGVDVLPNGAGATPLLDVTQAVGSIFDTRSILVANNGRYDLTVADVGWPAKFQNLELALTRGGVRIGTILGGGTFSFDATPGTYIATFIANPDGKEQAGLYSILIASSTPAVTLSADQTTIPSGQGVRLTWTSTGATGCTASGAWSGPQATSGNSVAVGPLTANSTFTLTCDGPGGTSAPASVTVTVTPPPGSHGGGGALDVGVLAALGSLLCLRRFSRRR